MGLERVAEVWRRLRPEGLSCPVVAVAGTNGKGSSVALLDAMLRAAGYRVGSYTSPHLRRYNERIRVAGHEAGDARIMAAFERIDAARGDISLTYFEFGTLAALDIFATAGLDVLVLEVGMGGRLDAVNIIDADVALVTTVDLDHTAWLGTDRQSIALEKVGIARRGRPLVFGEVPPDSVNAFVTANAVPLYVAGREFHAQAGVERWDWRYGDRRYADLPLPGLVGQVQLRNAAAVLMVLDRLADRLPVSDAAIRRGLREVALPGRFQVVDGAVPTIVDVAHNPQAAGELAATLRRTPCAGLGHAVFGMLADKDIRGVVAAMAPVVDVWHVAGLADGRAASLETLCGILAGMGVPGNAVFGYASVGEALSGARRSAKPGDRVLAFGSFLVAAEVLTDPAPGAVANAVRSPLSGQAL